MPAPVLGATQTPTAGAGGEAAGGGAGSPAGGSSSGSAGSSPDAGSSGSAGSAGQGTTGGNAGSSGASGQGGASGRGGGGGTSNGGGAVAGSGGGSGDSCAGLQTWVGETAPSPVLLQGDELQFMGTRYVVDSASIEWWNDVCPPTGTRADWCDNAQKYSAVAACE